MKRSPRIGFCSLVLICSIALFSGSFARSQTASDAGSARDAKAGAAASSQKELAVQQAGTEEKKAAEPESETEAFRHSPAVRKLASLLHLPLETAARLFEFLNFGILAFTILYFGFKLVPKAFRTRRVAIEKELTDARSATDVANERLQGVEQRLSRLDQEIEAIRKNVEQDAIADQARIKAALEEERLRIVDSAGHEIEAAVATAQRELKRFAAELAVERATSQFSLTAETDRKLVQNFSRGLGTNNPANSTQGGRN